MKPYFTEETVAEIKKELRGIESKADRLVLGYTLFSFSKAQAQEYAHHGFMRRVRTLQRCIQNVFGVIPPERVVRPEKTELDDAQINLQAFYANIYGAVDNLAWIWVFERGPKNIDRRKVGLRKRHAEIRSSLSAAFQKYLEGLDEWFEYVVEFRDALAHRIPLYIPLRVQPENVDAYNALSRRMSDALGRFDHEEYQRLYAEQDKLLVFQPLITHSVSESTAHIFFHGQLIADFNTVEELGRKMLEELKGGKAAGLA